jgi:hypothetical protein
LLASHARILEDFLMRLLRSARWLLLALVITLIPVSSQAGVFISVGFAPPVLPVYEQPPCPEPGLMWTPGYWAYGPDGYYWVPGAWVPAPYEGALWTPPYWGWSGGLYVLHEGYWGRHIGYYGGVNYGFGYGGIGFAGGEWHGHDFRYNTAVDARGQNGSSTIPTSITPSSGTPPSSITITWPTVAAPAASATIRGPKNVLPSTISIWTELRSSNSMSPQPGPTEIRMSGTTADTRRTWLRPGHSARNSTRSLEITPSEAAARTLLVRGQMRNQEIILDGAAVRTMPIPGQTRSLEITL